MKCPACGASLIPINRFCKDCGQPRPRWPEPFEHCLDRFNALTAQWEQGKLNDAQYEATLRELAFAYDDAYWTIGARSGSWFRHDSKRWVVDEPPFEATAASDQGAQPFTLPPSSGRGQGTPAASARPVLATSTVGPRPTVRLTLPDEQTALAARLPMDSATPFQARENQPASNSMGCVKPALAGFLVALILLCVLLTLAAWLQPSLLRPLTHLLWPGS